MTRAEICNMLTKITKKIAPEVLEITISEPRRARADQGTYCALFVQISGGIKGKVSLYWKDGNSTYNMLPVMKTLEGGEKKMVGYVSFGEDFIGDSYFRYMNLIQGLAALAITCM